MDKKAAAKGFGWQVFFTLINKLVLPIATLLMAREVGKSVWGLYALMYFVFNAAEVFRDAGLTQTYLREKEVDPHKEGAYMALGILQSALPALLLFLFREPIAAFFKEPALANAIAWVSLALLINGIGTIPRAKVLRAGRLYESGLRETMANIIAVAAAFVMVFAFDLELTALIALLVLNSVMNVVITYGIAPVTRFTASLREIWDTFRKSSSTMGANIFFTAYSLADTGLIGRLFAAADVGLYSVARNLALKPQQLVNGPLIRTMQVGFGQNAEDKERLGRLYARAVAGSVMFAAPLYVVLGFGAPAIVEVLLGPDWLDAVPLVQILCVYYGARTVGAVGGSALVAGGKARFTMTSWFWCYLTAILILALNWGRLDLVLVSWAFTAGAVVVYALHTLFAMRYFQVPADGLKKVGLAFATGLATGLFVWALQLIPAVGWLVFLVTLALAPIFHFAVLGLALEGRPHAYLSVAGAKKLYKSL